MVASLVAFWMTAVLGQTPAAGAEAAWLKAVPADVEVVARVRGIEPARADLLKMFGAMSPSLAEMAGPLVEQIAGELAGTYGKEATTRPILILFRLPKPKSIGTPPYAVLVDVGDYAALQKGIIGAGVKGGPKHQPGGYDLLTDAQNHETYTYKGRGFVAFGNHEPLIAAIARPKATIDSVITPDLRERLYKGDLGIYAQLVPIRERYREEIDKARLRMIERAAAAPPGVNIGAGKSAVDFLFDSLKDSRALALSFDFAAAGLDLAGQAEVQPGSPTARFLTGKNAGKAEGLGRLPADLVSFIYSSVNPEMVAKLQESGRGLPLGLGDATSPEAKEARELQQKAGLREVITGGAMAGPGGFRQIVVATYDDPRKAVEATSLIMKAAKANPGTASSILKEVRIEPKAQSHRGFTLDRASMTFDLAKMAQEKPNSPNWASVMKATMGESLSTWYGTDGKVFLSVTATDWDRARALIDAAIGGTGSIGQSAGFRLVRSKLPEKVNGLGMISSQGLVRQLATLFAAQFPDNPALKTPADLPKEPALLGGAVDSVVDGLRFQLILPSNVGPIIEKGLLPLFMGMGAQVNQ